MRAALSRATRSASLRSLKSRTTTCTTSRPPTCSRPRRTSAGNCVPSSRQWTASKVSELFCRSSAALSAAISAAVASVGLHRRQEVARRTLAQELLAALGAEQSAGPPGCTRKSPVRRPAAGRRAKARTTRRASPGNRGFRVPVRWPGGAARSLVRRPRPAVPRTCPAGP